MGTAISCTEYSQVAGLIWWNFIYQCGYTLIPPSHTHHTHTHHTHTHHITHTTYTHTHTHYTHTHTPGFSLGSDPSGIQSVQRKVRTRVVSSGSSFISCLPYFFILASTCVCMCVGREGGRGEVVCGCGGCRWVCVSVNVCAGGGREGACTFAYIFN